MAESNQSGLSRRPASWIHRYRGPAILAVALAGLAVSLGLFAYTRTVQGRYLEVRFDKDAEDRVVVIERLIEQTLEKIHTLADAYQRDPDRSQTEFERIVQPWLDRQPSINAMGYIRAVPHDQRAALERELDAMGALLYEQPLGSPKQRRPSKPREVYYPLMRLMSRNPEQIHDALGFDAGSSPARLAGIQRARDTGKLVTSTPVPLASSDTPGIIGWEPIYRGGTVPATVAQRRAGLIGLVAGSIRIRQIVRAAMATSREGEMVLRVFDITDTVKPVLLINPGRTGPDQTLPEGESLASLSARPTTHTADLFVGGRTWRVLCSATPSYTRGVNPWAPWGVLGAGLLCTGLVLYVLLAQARYAGQLGRISAERAQINQKLAQRYAEKRSAERALSTANDQLRAVNTEMEQFVSSVSHDLKSPLITTAMLVDMLEQEVAQGRTDRVMEAAGHIAKATRRMHRIVDNLIEHNRAGWSTLQPAEVDLRDVALDVAEGHQEAATARHVAIEVDQAMPAITADRGWILTALNNLVSNALKYGCDQDHPRIRIGAEPRGDQVSLFVHDNGPGLDADQREKVFELFTRFSHDQEGTGIGLAIVQRVARSHGGHAWIDCPDNGGGCAFHLTLPQTPSPTPGSKDRG